MKDKKKDYEVTLEVLEERLDKDEQQFKFALILCFMFYTATIICLVLSTLKIEILGIGICFGLVTILIFIIAIGVNNQECSREILYYLKSQEK